jgi:hypothetical protein
VGFKNYFSWPSENRIHAAVKPGAVPRHHGAAISRLTLANLNFQRAVHFNSAQLTA